MPRPAANPRPPYPNARMSAYLPAYSSARILACPHACLYTRTPAYSHVRIPPAYLNAHKHALTRPCAQFISVPECGRTSSPKKFFCFSAKYFFGGLAAQPGIFLSRLKRGQPRQSRLYAVGRVIGAQALSTDIPYSGQFEHRAHASARNNSSTFRSGHKQHFARPNLPIAS